MITSAMTTRARSVAKVNIMQEFSVQAPQQPKKPRMRTMAPRMMKRTEALM